MGDSIKRARHFFLIVRMETQKIAYLRITAGQRSVPDFEDHVILRHLAAADNLQKAVYSYTMAGGKIPQFKTLQRNLRDLQEGILVILK